MAVANPSSPALGIAHMRSVYRCADVEKRLAKLPAQDHEPLRTTYERMLERGPERFQVKPCGLPAMDRLYEDLPNFHAVLDDLRRQLALVHDSGDRQGRAARMRRWFPDADVVVFGHSHEPCNEAGDADQVLFNPGSSTWKRRAPSHTFGVIEVGAGQILRAEILEV